MTNYIAAIETKSVAATDGIKIDYTVVGTGDPIVLLHGLFAGRAAFSRQHALADRWKLIMPSTRAHDGSDGRLPPGYGIGTSELDDLLAVLDAERVDRFHLVGHSSGGTLAFAFVKKFPSRVNRLVLIEPSLFGLLNAPDRRAISTVFTGFVETGIEHGDRAAMSKALQWLGGDAWNGLDDARKSARLDALQPMAHLIVPHMRSLVDFEATTEDVERFTMPTLLIYGGASFPVQPQIADRFQALRPDWRQVTVDGAGHNCFREQPAVVNAAIRQFLTE